MYLQVLKLSVLCKCLQQLVPCPASEKPKPLYIPVGIMPWHLPLLSASMESDYLDSQPSTHITLYKAGPQPYHTLSHGSREEPDSEIADQTVNTSFQFLMMQFMLVNKLLKLKYNPEYRRKKNIWLVRSSTMDGNALLMTEVKENRLQVTGRLQ